MNIVYEVVRGILVPQRTPGAGARQARGGLHQGDLGAELRPAMKLQGTVSPISMPMTTGIPRQTDDENKVVMTDLGLIKK